MLACKLPLRITFPGVLLWLRCFHVANIAGTFCAVSRQVLLPWVRHSHTCHLVRSAPSRTLRSRSPRPLGSVLGWIMTVVNQELYLCMLFAETWSCGDMETKCLNNRASRVIPSLLGTQARSLSAKCSGGLRAASACSLPPGLYVTSDTTIHRQINVTRKYINALWSTNLWHLIILSYILAIISKTSEPMETA